MNREAFRDIVIKALARLAPEADLAHLPPGAQLREELDLDSVDFLNLVLALHKELHVEIPESDYRELATLDSVIAYLERHVPFPLAEPS